MVKYLNYTSIIRRQKKLALFLFFFFINNVFEGFFYLSWLK